MEKEQKKELKEEEQAEEIELVMFQVPECYVYLIPPRKTAASYRADEWNINKWAWEGTLRVISKGVECIIRLEDKTTGELYAQAFLRDGEPHPVEAVIDSSRYFVLRVEEDMGGRLRHAFIGIGFRERPQAYDFQAALHDHMKYVHKKKAAEEMEQQYQQSSSVDYSLKEGETMVLQIKNKTAGSIKSKFFELGLNKPSPDYKSNETSVGIKLPPPPPPPPSPVVTPESSPRGVFSKMNFEEESSKKSASELEKIQTKESESPVIKDISEDDFGDFQAA